MLYTRYTYVIRNAAGAATGFFQKGGGGGGGGLRPAIRKAGWGVGLYALDTMRKGEGEGGRGGGGLLSEEGEVPCMKGGVATPQNPPVPLYPPLCSILYNARVYNKPFYGVLLGEV